MNKRKILGVDYGDFSIGLAVFDLETDFIYPIKTIFRYKANVLRKSVREIVEIAKIEKITDIVIGLPLNADGTAGDRVEKVKTFAHMLENAFANMTKSNEAVEAKHCEPAVGADITCTIVGANGVVGANFRSPHIYFQDERLTTVEAKTILAEHGIKKEDWKKNIDQIAAELILQDFKQANKL